MYLVCTQNARRWALNYENLHWSHYGKGATSTGSLREVEALSTRSAFDDRHSRASEQRPPGRLLHPCRPLLAAAISLGEVLT